MSAGGAAGEGAEIHTCLLSCVFRSGLDDTRLPYFLRWGLSFALELIKWLDGWPTGPGDPSVSSFPLLGLQVFATRPRYFM